MDEQLKFSWGHIIAFLALIFISYITFVGEVYMTDGDFTKAAIKMVVVDIVLAIFLLVLKWQRLRLTNFLKGFGWSE